MVRATLLTTYSFQEATPLAPKYSPYSPSSRKRCSKAHQKVHPINVNHTDIRLVYNVDDPLDIKADILGPGTFS